jgi:hypothetical protein
MTFQNVDVHAIESFRKFYKLLPRSEDASLVILKLHLLVEEQIRAFVDERLQTKKALENAKLECHQAICLAEALSSEDIHSNSWEAARKLNSLRNQIAHSIEPKGVTDRMNHICSLVGVLPFPPDAEAKTPEVAAIDNLRLAVSMLYTEISLFVKRKPVQVLSLVPDSSEA